MKIYTALSTAHAIRVTAGLVADLPRDIDKKTYVFCESKATLSFEREIATLTGGTFNAEVMSFSRYVSKNVKVENFLSKAQASLLVRKLMKEHESELVRLKPEAFSVPTEVYGLISQLKAALVKPSDLTEIIQAERGALRTKLKDIETVYRLYEDYVTQNRLTDESAYLSLMEGALLKDEKLKGANVIVAAVQSYTKQTLNVLRALNKVSDLNFVCVSGNYSSYTNESVNKISGLFPGAEVIPLREEGKTEQYAIAKGLFDPFAFSDGGIYSDKIKVAEANTVNEECDAIAAVIRYEVTENKRRYKDFSVVCQNLSDFAPKLKESFFLYDIPLYVDESKNLDKHPVIGLIGGLIDVRRFNLLPQKAIELAKNGLFCSFEESRDFTKYIYENAISRKQMKEPFGDLIAESVRGRIEAVTSKFALKDSVSNYIEQVKSSLDYLDVFNRGQAMSDSLKEYGEGVTAEFNDGALKALSIFLDEVDRVLGSVKVSLNEFKNIIISASASVKVSTVPEYNDTVYLGDFKGGRLKESKILFCPELNFSVPDYKADVALLNDRELTKMDGYKLIIEPKLQIVNERERENIAVTMMSFTDRLYLSYSNTDSKGKAVLRSEIIDRILSIFSSSDNKPLLCKMEVSSLIPENVPAKYLSKKAGMLYGAITAEKFRERSAGDLKDLAAFTAAIKDEGEYQSLIDYSEPKLCNEDLSYTGKFSATTIETFFSCPYKAFAQGLLKLKESANGETKVYEIGNVLHNVMEKFINKFSEVKDRLSARILAEKLFDEEIKTPLYARYLNKPQYKNIFLLLKEEAIKECERVYTDISNSTFKPIGAEIEFNESGKNGLYPIYLKTPSGSIALRGKIDRADEYFDGKDRYFRIIDYKSGQADSEDSSFYAGKKVQLYLYMNVFAKLGYIPAGAHYFKLSDEYGATDVMGGEYLGKCLPEKEIIGKLDNDFLDSGESKNLGVKLKKDGTVSQNKNLLSRKEFASYMDYAVKVCESGAEEMQKGCFIPSPSNDACEYCKYKGLCGYDAESGDNNRDVLKGNKNSILNAEDDNA